MTRTGVALVALAAAAAAALLSGGSPADPRTPPALPGLPPPFGTAAVLGDGGLTAGVDAYGDVVDLRRGPAGPALIDNPRERQAAGTVSPQTGIVPRVAVRGGPWRPLWRADRVRQLYRPDSGVLRTTAAFGDARVAIECAASDMELGCARAGSDPAVRLDFAIHPGGGTPGVHLGDARAREIVDAARAANREWLGAGRGLGPGAPAWARRMQARSLLVMRALADRRTGAVAAGARDGWAYVWPRDAGAVAIALAASGHRREARRIAGFLDRVDLAAAARFDGRGDPVPGRRAQGDAVGWARAAARAAGRPGGPGPGARWRDRPDYQEKAPGDYLANALANADGPKTPFGMVFSAHRQGGVWGLATRRGLVREAGEPESGLDSAAAWAVRPFPRPALFGPARRTLLSLPRAQTRRLGPGAARFGLVPSEHWPEADPWTAPTAWSAWALAALARADAPAAVAGGERRAALRLLASLRRAATSAGMLPERVDARSGVPRSTAPLAWSHAFAALALLELWPPRTLRPRR